ncbi:hypothetical protein TNIN_498991 [Trichonephila inaurata madagascariensis]|uniref:Uncharacterized protein n=1 Tax=Trichonephila inaurata madagascariensis TaxID=2747483 RepID=A0A8X7BR54_9ARAC|nr:hypothetical protein TNIN_498991 [Trichonephila inaurata madagascariensis]
MPPGKRSSWKRRAAGWGSVFNPSFLPADYLFRLDDNTACLSLSLHFCGDWLTPRKVKINDGRLSLFVAAQFMWKPTQRHLLFSSDDPGVRKITRVDFYLARCLGEKSVVILLDSVGGSRSLGENGVTIRMCPRSSFSGLHQR